MLLSIPMIHDDIFLLSTLLFMAIKSLLTFLNIEKNKQKMVKSDKETEYC